MKDEPPIRNPAKFLHRCQEKNEDLHFEPPSIKIQRVRSSCWTLDTSLILSKSYVVRMEIKGLTASNQQMGEQDHL